MPAYRPESERFWEKVEKNEDGCWNWTAGCFGRNQEYGCFYLTGGRKAIPAHVWAYTNVIGPVPGGLVLDHLCENTKCVNPAHLNPTTNRENVLRGNSICAKEARQTHCRKGHSLEDAHITKKGSRDCRICRKMRADSRTPEYRRIHG